MTILNLLRRAVGNDLASNCNLLADETVNEIAQCSLGG